MAEYCLIKNGEIINMVITRETLAQLKAHWPDHEVVPVESVPQGTLENYEYWNKRP